MTAFLAAIILVESGGDPNAVGDGGKSLGLMQISRAYYTDAVVQLRHEGLGLTMPGYEVAVKNHFWCETLFRAYMRRYCPRAYFTNDYETMARVHNGGPRGAKRQATVAYWQKVKAAMEGGE